MDSSSAQSQYTLIYLQGNHYSNQTGRKSSPGGHARSLWAGPGSPPSSVVESQLCAEPWLSNVPETLTQVCVITTTMVKLSNDPETETHACVFIKQRLPYFLKESGKSGSSLSLDCLVSLKQRRMPVFLLSNGCLTSWKRVVILGHHWALIV